METNRMGAPDHLKLFGRTVRGLFWQSSAVFLLGVFQLGVLAILARRLAPADFGLVALINVLMTVTANAFQMGLGPALIQRKDVTPDDSGFVFFLTVLSGALAALLFWAVAPVLAESFGWPGLKPWLPVAGLAVLASNLGLVSAATLQKDMRFRIQSSIDVAAYLLGYAGPVLALALFGFGAGALVLGLLLQQVVRTALLLAVRPPGIRFRFAKAGARSILGYGGAMTMAQLMNQIGLQADNYVVGRFLGSAALGFYERSFFLMNLASRYFGRVLDAVMFPAMAQIQDQHGHLQTGYLAAIGALNTVLICVSVAGFLCADDIIRLVLGPQWSAAVLPFKILMLALPFRTTIRVGDSLARAVGRVGRNAAIKTVYAAAVVGFSLAGIRLGIGGVAGAVALAVLLHYAMMLDLVGQAIRLSWRRQLAAHVPGLVLGALVWCTGKWVLGATVRLSLPVRLGSFGLLAPLGAGLVVLAFPGILGEPTLWLMAQFKSRLRSRGLWIGPRQAPAAATSLQGRDGKC